MRLLNQRFQKEEKKSRARKEFEFYRNLLLQTEEFKELKEDLL